MITTIFLALLLQAQTVARIAVTVPVDPPTMLEVKTPGPAWAGTVVFLRWKASPDQNCKGWSGYVMYRSIGVTGPFVPLNRTMPAKGTLYLDGTVSKGHVYRYEVVATVGKVVSKPSNIVLVKP
jgi:hypothetical protein